MSLPGECYDGSTRSACSGTIYEAELFHAHQDVACSVRACAAQALTIDIHVKAPNC